MQTPGVQKELDRAKVALMQTKEAVFFTTIVFSLKFQWDDTIPTAATNGYYLKMNPDFFMKATKEQRVFVLVHEACHVAYDHMGRLGKRDMQLWNKAADHVINLMLKARGFKMWDWVLADPRFVDMSAEQVYKILEAEQDDTENPMPDVHMPSNEPGEGGSKPQPIDPVEHQRHIENILVRAATQAKIQGEAGSIPGDVEVFLKTLLNPRLPWQQLLRREVGQMAKNRYSWTRRNRRFPDIYLPSLHSQAPAEMTFYVDISGSVMDHQFNIFVSEIAGALRMFNLTKVRIVQFDTRIQHDDTVRSVAALSKIKFHGRGGTWIEPVLEHIEKHKPQLSAIFTDGEFSMTQDTLKHRLLWLINDNPSFTAPFGQVTHFSTE